MNKLEDIMNEYDLKNTDLVGSEILDTDEKSRILKRTLEKARLDSSQTGSEASPADAVYEDFRRGSADAGTKKRTPMPRRRMAILLASSVLILTMASISFASLALDIDVLDFFRAGAQKDIDALNARGTLINKQVTNNGLTIDIREAIGDKNTVNVFFDIIAPEDMTLDRSYYDFQQHFVDFENAHFSLGYHFTELPDPELSDNKRSFVLSLSAGKNLPGKTMTLSFQDFCTYKMAEEMESEILIPGTWEISFPLNYTDHSFTWKPNMEIPLENGDLKVKEVTLSPLSISFVLKGPWLERLDAGLGHEDLIVRLKDGGAALIDSSGRSTEAFSRINLNYQFLGLIHPEDIESIELGGVTIPLGF